MVAWYRFIHDSLAQQLRKCTALGVPVCVYMRLNSVSVKQRADGTRLMTICRTATVPPTRSVVLAHIIVIPSRAPDTHTHARTHTDTYTRGRPFNFPSVSRFCAERSGIRLFRVVYLSRMPGLLYGAPSLLACLLRLGLFFSSFFWNLRWASRDRFASLLLWWGFKLEIICRVMGVRVATLPSLFSVELNVPLLSFPKRGKTIA